MNYSKISLFDIANGNGIRVSLFVSGCKFHCRDCFNSQAWDYKYGKEFTDKEEAIIVNRLKNENFQGLSILGGDPLWQDDDGIDQLIKLCKKCHAIGKDVWIWSGFTWDKLSDKQMELIKECDVFIDGLFEVEKKDLSLAWRGSSNQRVIDVKESLKLNKIIEKGV